MLDKKIIIAVAGGLVVAACGSDPYAYSEPRYVSSGAYASPAAYSEGRVVAIDVVRGGGRSTGAGAVVGGIVGGVLGHQIGSGRGNDAATVAGAVGGAVVGNELEKRRDGDEQYRIVVQTRDGREAVFTQDSLNGIRVGDRVRIDGNRLYRD
ncbi:MAG TPA: glycine zipper 2TM domain-containing protein [Usitatibacter sp.]|nr:glycine zipper 2TM domain-containing protein [Usitatibacter sp.]